MSDILDLLEERHGPIRAGADCGEGWFTILSLLNTGLESIDPQYRIAQIKEKFGGLRFYADPTSALFPEQRDRFYDLIHAAEAASLTVCEVCGERGEPQGPGWIQTLCDDCARKRAERRASRG